MVKIKQGYTNIETGSQPGHFVEKIPCGNTNASDIWDQFGDGKVVEKVS